MQAKQKYSEQNNGWQGEKQEEKWVKWLKVGEVIKEVKLSIGADGN